MSKFSLYGNRESGHSFKVKLALTVSQIAHEYHEIDINIPRNERPEPFRSIARYGEVPVLVHEDRSIVQSNAILCHLAEHLQMFGGESASRMDRVREWLFWEANRVGMCLPQLRYGRAFAPNDYPEGAMIWLQQRFDLDIMRLDRELDDGRAYILDDQPTVADFSLCGYMFWPEQAKVSYPKNVDRWLANIRSLDGWKHPYEIVMT